MNDWFIPIAAASLGLFVFFKVLRFFCTPSSPPEKKEQGVPPGEEELARRARDLFLSVQKAWDARDMETLGSLATPGALEELEAQAAAAGHSVTEVLHVSAETVSRLEGEDADRLSVLFDVVLREGTSGILAGPVQDAEPAAFDGEPFRVRELWHIVRSGGEWRVDAVRQVG